MALISRIEGFWKVSKVFSCLVCCVHVSLLQQIAHSTRPDKFVFCVMLQLVIGQNYYSYSCRGWQFCRCVSQHLSEGLWNVYGSVQKDTQYHAHFSSCLTSGWVHIQRTQSLKSDSVNLRSRHTWLNLSTKWSNSHAERLAITAIFAKR